MLFNRSVRLLPAQRENLTDLFEIVCVMFGVPLGPEAARLAFGPPTLQNSQIFWGYDGLTGRIPQESSILFRTPLLFAYPILFTFSLKPIPSADQRFVPNINDGIIGNIIFISRWDDT
jgi:hypothetical protein